MSTRLVSLNAHGERKEIVKPTALDRLARRIVLSRFEKLQDGQIVVSENGEHLRFGELTDNFPLTAQLRVLSPKFYSDIAFGGSIGAGEAFIHGYWSCSQLSDLLSILLRNR